MNNKNPYYEIHDQKTIEVFQAIKETGLYKIETPVMGIKYSMIDNLLATITENKHNRLNK